MNAKTISAQAKKRLDKQFQEVSSHACAVLRFHSEISRYFYGNVGCDFSRSLSFTVQFAVFYEELATNL
jgi:hypothetical protein